MRIALSHGRRFMPQQSLYLVQIDSGLDHPSGTGMAKVMEMEIVNPCPFTRSHPGVLEGIPVFPLMEEAATDSRSLSEQRLVGQTIEGDHFGHPFDRQRVSC